MKKRLKIFAMEQKIRFYHYVLGHYKFMTQKHTYYLNQLGKYSAKMINAENEYEKFLRK